MTTTENGVENAASDLGQPDQLSLNSTPITMQQVKHRPTFSEDQVASLESVFEKKQYLSSAERTQLANSINLTAQQVRVWFQNRRQKAKAYMSLRHADKSAGLIMDLYILGKCTHDLCVVLMDQIKNIHTGSPT